MLSSLSLLYPLSLAGVTRRLTARHIWRWTCFACKSDFSDWWFAMRYQVTDVCIFVKEIEPLLSKDSNEISLIRKNKPSKLSEINSYIRILWHITTGVWITAGKNKLHWCHASCSLIHSHCLVSSRNAVSPLLRDETKQRPSRRIWWCLLPFLRQRQNQNCSMTASCLKNTLPHNFVNVFLCVCQCRVDSVATHCGTLILWHDRHEGRYPDALISASIPQCLWSYTCPNVAIWLLRAV